MDAEHPLETLARQLDWAALTERWGPTYAITKGAPGVNTRLLVALHYIKEQHQQHDQHAVIPVLAYVRHRQVVADKGFDADIFRAQHARCCIPPINAIVVTRLASIAVVYRHQSLAWYCRDSRSVHRGNAARVENSKSNRIAHG